MPHRVPAARQAAIEVLRLTLEKGIDLQEALDTVLANGGLSEVDKGLATELSYGSLRLKGRIEAILSNHLRPGKTQPAVLRILSLAAYEILFLERIPAYASVNWAVDAVRRSAGQGPSRMANAVLRKVAATGREANGRAFFEKSAATPEDVLASHLSAPPWLVALWTRAYGATTAAVLLEACLAPPPLGLRINGLRPGAAELLDSLRSSPGFVAGAGLGVALSSPPDGLSGMLHSGLASRQSLAAQEAIVAIEPDTWPVPVWDACAGRGGKSFLLAEQKFPVWASDVSTRRLKGLCSERVRLGVDLPAFAASATEPPLKRPPGTVLLDAPCSGLGVLSRRPDIKWKRTPKDIYGLVELQSRMLLAAHDLLGPGGVIAYVTCTLNPDENERQVQRLIGSRPGTTLEREFRTDPSSPLREFFYAALLRKAWTPS
jgi:16S rRNA (cytosine967-C5)-methyltransferase